MKAIFMTLCPRVFQTNKKGDNMFDNVVLHRNSRSWTNAFQRNSVGDKMDKFKDMKYIHPNEIDSI
jgi:hypothetical protein